MCCIARLMTSKALCGLCVDLDRRSASVTNQVDNIVLRETTLNDEFKMS